MHPILADLRRLAVYLAGWLVVGGLLTIGFRPGGEWAIATALLLPLSLVYGFISLSGWYVCRAFPIRGAGNTWNAVDRDRVKRFMDKVRKSRDRAAR